MKAKVLASVAVLAVVTPALAAGPASSGNAGRSPHVELEAIPGSPAKRIRMTAKAIERLGIELGQVGLEPVVRTQVVSGLVVPPFDAVAATKTARSTFGGFAPVSAPPAAAPLVTKSAGAAEAWLLVTLSEAEWSRVAKDKPARVRALATREQLAGEISAVPSGMPPVEDSKRSMLSLYYKLPPFDNGNGVALNKRMRVELPLEGTERKNKTVPYSAIYYDARGGAWVYLNPYAGVFERRRVGIERIVGDVAVLNDGPPLGTSVVTVGAPLLYGTEIFGK